MKPNDLLLITFDLRKDYKVIEAAYDDHLGVSRDFDMNVLFRINQELKGNFNLDKFFFHSYFDAVEGCIKNFLISKEEQ
jgi:L-histidine N-alpha-methyltransferase